MAKKKILMLLHLPPPVHGACAMNAAVVASKVLQQAFSIRYINITADSNIDAIGKFSIKKIFIALNCYCKLLWYLISFKPDLLYITLSPSGFAFYRDSFFVWIGRCFRVHITFHLHGQGIKAGAANSALFKRIATRIFNKTSVIFLSEHLVSDAIEFTNHKYYIVPNGIPEQPDAHVYSSNNEASEHSEGFTKVLFLSNYVRSKGILILIEAALILARENKKIKIYLVGKPFDISIQELETYIKQRDLSSIIKVCGPQYGAAKMEYYHQSDIFALPTYNDALPLVLLEAMQFSLPIISTFEGGIPDIVQDGVNGFLIPTHHPEALAEKIKYLIENPSLSIAMGKKGKVLFHQHFTLHQFENNLLRVFNTILKST